MNIRKYTTVFIILLMISLISFTVLYQKQSSKRLKGEFETSDNYIKIARTKDKEIQIYKNEQWQDIKLKGVEISSFKPGYQRHETSIKKKDVLKWLEQISELNANVIKIPNIQSPSFYKAIYEYNLKASNPIYTIHEVMLDEKTLLDRYDAYDEKIIKHFKKDIKKTINVIHGNSLILSNKRTHRGLYLNDISSYNIGYILGTNTNSEMITLTNLRNKEKNSYEGKYYNVKDGSPFEIFVSEMMDHATSYELKKYEQLSLFSYLTSIETDPFAHRQESNQTRYAKINMMKITPLLEENIFASYSIYPSSVNFLEYETSDKDNAANTYIFGYLKKLNNYYSFPIIASDIGISSSRGKSEVDEDDGFHRGGFSEKEQGERLVSLLESVESSGISGSIIKSWQDDWTNLSSLRIAESYLDKTSSSYWWDAQSSDQSFGLLSFESGKENETMLIDGRYNDWKDSEYLLDEKSLKLKVKSDESFLYMLIEKEDWKLNEDNVYIGLDVTPLSGSNHLKEENIKFKMPVDFVVKLNGYNESRILVQERYDLFSYLYKYYMNIIEKKDSIPSKDSTEFSPIYLLNRKKFYLRDNDKILYPLYYETGILKEGSNNIKDKDHNSLVDFNKNEDVVELKIPWSLLNMVNPVEKGIYDDFYNKGIERQINVNDIGISLHVRDKKGEVDTDSKRFKIGKYKDVVYYERLKDSYSIVKKYWKGQKN